MSYQLTKEDHKTLFDIIAKEDGGYSTNHAIYFMIRIGQHFSIFPTLVKPPKSIFSETNEEREANIEALKKQHQLMEEYSKNDFQDYPFLSLNNEFIDYFKKRKKQTIIKFLTYIKNKNNTNVSPWQTTLSTLANALSNVDDTRDYEKEYKRLLEAFVWAVEHKEYYPKETNAMDNFLQLTKRLTSHEEKYLEKTTLSMLIALSEGNDKLLAKPFVIEFIKNHKTISSKNLELYQKLRSLWKNEDLLGKSHIYKNEINNFINETMPAIEKRFVSPHYYYVLDMNELARQLDHSVKIVKRNFAVIGQIIENNLHAYELLSETWLIEYKYHRQQGILKVYPRNEKVINLIEEIFEVTKSITKNKQEIFLSDAEKIWEQCKLKIYLENNLNKAEEKGSKFKL